MSHTYVQNALHVVFSTRQREKTIRDPARLWEYTAAICQKLDVHVQAVGGTTDHIHLLIQIPPTIPVAKVVLTVKTDSSKRANQLDWHFAWQKGYAAFSVSASAAPSVIAYIRNQPEHHRKMNFEQEFLALLKKHNVPYDPQYVLG